MAAAAASLVPSTRRVVLTELAALRSTLPRIHAAASALKASGLLQSSVTAAATSTSIRALATTRSPLHHQPTLAMPSAIAVASSSSFTTTKHYFGVDYYNDGVAAITGIATRALAALPGDKWGSTTVSAAAAAAAAVDALPGGDARGGSVWDTVLHDLGEVARGRGVQNLSVAKQQMQEEDLRRLQEEEEEELMTDGVVLMSGVLKKRRKKMNRHKYRKWRKRNRTELRKKK